MKVSPVPSVATLLVGQVIIIASKRIAIKVLKKQSANVNSMQNVEQKLEQMVCVRAVLSAPNYQTTTDVVNVAKLM